MLPNTGSSTDAKVAAKRIGASVHHPIHVGAVVVPIAASVGPAGGDGTVAPCDLVRQSDTVMNEAG